MSQTERCIKEFDMVLTDLRAQGMDTIPIMSALGEIMAKIARNDPEGLPALESAVAVLDASTKAIRDKNAKRRKITAAIFGDDDQP